MKLHEYQARNILDAYGLPIPKGVHVESSDIVTDILLQHNIEKGLVKAQAYTGGRGKAGGVKFFNTIAEAKELTEKIIGMTLVTHQTGPQGVLVDSALLVEPTDIKHEYYVAITVDRARFCPTLILSPDGGMDIEEVAEKTPERLLTIPLLYSGTIPSHIISEAAAFLSLSHIEQELGSILQGLYDAFRDYDAMLLEINPLCTDVNDNLYILDTKFDIDDNAIYRQEKSGGDPNAEKTESEIEAKKRGMSYISLDGEIGCMVNGAGLAMATMDSIKYYGKEPANFLDVGGSANEQAVEEAFKLISADPQVKCIFINIFGGIMKCDTIALGIVSAVKKVGLHVPLVVRLEGTNVAEGKQIITQSGLNIISADNLADGAEKAVSLIKSA